LVSRCSTITNQAKPIRVQGAHWKARQPSWMANFKSSLGWSGSGGRSLELNDIRHRQQVKR
jgi:hypothetical protein